VLSKLACLDGVHDDDDGDGDDTAVRLPISPVSGRIVACSSQTKKLMMAGGTAAKTARHVSAGRVDAAVFGHALREKHVNVRWNLEGFETMLRDAGNRYVSFLYFPRSIDALQTERS
jgi:hypothetical protein